MNESRQEILRLCANQPKTTRQLVKETGATASAVRSRLHYLVNAGALRATVLDDQYGTQLYRSVPGWRQPRDTSELTTYKPIGICVWGVWM